MPYAFEGGVSTSPVEGGIEITGEQYQQAVEAIVSGREVTITDGFTLRDIRPSEFHEWENGEWVDYTPEPEPDPEPTPSPEPEPVDLATYAAQRRWLREVGGVFVGGMLVATDDRSKMMIMGARIKADQDPSFTTRWKGPDGTFATLDAATIIIISDAVLDHVDRLFAIEAAVLADIASGEITTPEEVNAAFAFQD